MTVTLMTFKIRKIKEKGNKIQQDPTKSYAIFFTYVFTRL
jgi:hypothetical protein